jgi:uncharacterized membrane protein
VVRGRGLSADMLDSVTSPSSIIDWINAGGILIVLTFIVFANWKGYWISGREAKEMRKRIEQLELQVKELEDARNTINRTSV